MDLEPHKWTCGQVGNWLEKIGFKEYEDLFVKKHAIDGLSLLQLTEKDLKDPPLSLPRLGDIKKLMTQIHKLKFETTFKSPYLKDSFLEDQYSTIEEAIKKENCRKFLKNKKLSMNYKQSSGLVFQQPKEASGACFNPDFLKLSSSLLYFMFAGLVTSFTMVVVHDNVPNMGVYPPLPDLVLDNVPYIPWAFKACEAIIISFSFFVFILLVFHKHRFIIARRFFALSGTVFLLRCVTMVITSLSVPGTHLQCEPRDYHTLSQRVQMALKIFTGMGLSLKGVRTCGDYMFSGHTVVITMFNFFLNEYTTRSFTALHTIGWLGNIFAIFLILAAHEHYSIDVFFAFYITSRLFLYYHSLANNKILVQRDARTRVWFPLFSYFESSIDGRVPNHFEPIWTTVYNHLMLYYKRKRRDNKHND